MADGASGAAGSGSTSGAPQGGAPQGAPPPGGAPQSAAPQVQNTTSPSSWDDVFSHYDKTTPPIPQPGVDPQQYQAQYGEWVEFQNAQKAFREGLNKIKGGMDFEGVNVPISDEQMNMLFQQFVKAPGANLRLGPESFARAHLSSHIARSYAEQMAARAKAASDAAAQGAGDPAAGAAGGKPPVIPGESKTSEPVGGADFIGKSTVPLDQNLRGIPPLEEFIRVLAPEQFKNLRTA